jgi:hypothetical protein
MMVIAALYFVAGAYPREFFLTSDLKDIGGGQGSSEEGNAQQQQQQSEDLTVDV